jgi:hypothetical protein
VIDLDEFRETLGLQDSIFVERLFTLFDDDKNGTIDFREFTAGLSVFCQKATLDEKLKCILSSSPTCLSSLTCLILSNLLIHGFPCSSLNGLNGSHAPPHSVFQHL